MCPLLVTKSPQWYYYPYTPLSYSITSPHEFLQILKRTQGILTWLVVKTIFTNVPVDKTNDIFCKTVSKQNSTPAEYIEAHILSKLQLVSRQHKDNIYNITALVWEICSNRSSVFITCLMSKTSYLIQILNLKYTSFMKMRFLF